MSAATTWDYLEPASSPTRGGVAPGRRAHLRLVSNGPGVPGVPEPRTGSHLTRRGRLALTALVTLAIVALSVTMASGVSGSTGVLRSTVTVDAGQTLSQVAATELPGLPVGEGVVALQRANDLTSMQVHAGQVLVVPGR